MPSIDIILFAAFLTGSLVLGLTAGRRVKTLRQFAIGDKNFSTATVTYSLVVSWVTGGFFFNALQNIYTNGLIYILVFMGGSLAMLLYGQVLAVRMGEFLNNLSVAEAMRDLYGRNVQIITAVSGTLHEVGYLAMQFQVITKILSTVFGIEGIWVTFLVASVAILYSSFGGVRSVTITDIFQFAIFSTVLPLLGLIIWSNLKDSGQVTYTLLSNPLFSVRETVSWDLKFFSAVGLMSYYMIPNMSPAIFQRAVIARDLKQVKDAFTYAAVTRTIILLAVTWIAILLLSYNPHVDPSKLVNYLLSEFAYPGLKGIIAVALMAKVMSAADANLNASSVLVINDIIKPLRPSFKGSITTIRIVSLLIGIFALVLSIHIKGLLKLTLWGGSKYIPVVTVPFLLAVFGFRTSTRAVLIGMAAGFSMVLAWEYLLPYKDIPSITPSMLVNLIFLMGSHYLLREKGGWVGIKEPGPLLAARQARSTAWNGFVNAINHPAKFYGYLFKNLPYKETIYVLFGLYVLGATYISFFTISKPIITLHQKLYDHITYSVLITTAIFLSHPIWPTNLKEKRFIAFAWPLAVSYIFFVVGTILVVMNDFNQIQVMLFILNLVVTALLIDWPLMLALVLGGILLAIGVFHLYEGSFPLAEASNVLQFKAIYGIPLFISLLLAIIKNRQAKKTLEAQNSYLLDTKRGTQSQLTEMLAYKEELVKELGLNGTSLLDSTTADYIKQAIYRLTDYIRLQVNPISLDQLIEQTKALLKIQGFDIQPQILIKKHTKQAEIQVDVAKIQQLLVESISYIHAHNTTNKPISIVVEDTELGHSIEHIQGYTRKLAALKITITTESTLSGKQDIYLIDPNKTSTWLPANEKELPLIENARIVDAHYGYSDFDQGNTHVYVIPINVREVRGKVMELLREPAQADPEELKHPLAIKVEQELLNKLKTTKDVDIKIIEKALETIKTYHAGVKRKSGEPFFTHPINVALILLDYCKDQDAVVSALLHDSIEDTSLSLSQLQARFGKTVAMLVEKLTNLEDKARKFSLDNHEYIARLTQTEDKRVAYVKLADRLHNMRTIQGHTDVNKQKKIAQETFHLFVPMAKQLGLINVEKELREISLEVLNKNG